MNEERNGNISIVPEKEKKAERLAAGKVSLVQIDQSHQRYHLGVRFRQQVQWAMYFPRRG